MSLFQVAIVGRPNVGKSSIFNWLVGRRLAIVDDVAGVTRDRMVQVISHDDRYFEIVDTGGIGINDVDNLTTEIEDQINHALHTADLLMFVVDAKSGITALDEKVADRLRGVRKPILLVSNKADNDHLELETNEFYALGLGKPLSVSSKENRRKQQLLDAINSHLPDEASDGVSPEIAEPELKVAIVGRRNVGKSTFINALTGQPRCIVSEVAGTTRDSINVRFDMDNKVLVAIDTPGLRKGKSVRTDIEFYSTHRAKRSIRYSDVVLMFFDSSSRVSKVDRQLCKYINDHHKPCIFVVNKWDLMAEHMPTERWADYLRDEFRSMWNVPIAFITAQSGRNIKKLVNYAQMLFKQSRTRVATPRLNRLIKQALLHNPPPLATRRRPKIYYAVQVGVQPPTIVLKCNLPDAFSNSYRRYLLGVLRDELPFGEVPIRLMLERRDSSSAIRPDQQGNSDDSAAAQKSLDELEDHDAVFDTSESDDSVGGELQVGFSETAQPQFDTYGIAIDLPETTAERGTGNEAHRDESPQ